MAVPAYTTDLTTNEIFLDGGATFTLIGGGRVTVTETDDFIQGSSCWSHDPFSSGIEGGVVNSAETIASGNAVFFWLKCDVVATLATKAAGGMQAVIGDSGTTYKCWYVRGSDDYAAGGWVNVVIDPTVTASTTVGSPTSTTSWFGARWNVPSAGASKGYPMKIDAMRQGRGQVLINGGQSGSLATFAGLAAINDAQSAKWGLFEAQEGGAAGYRWKGLMSFGPTSLTEFTDSNVNIFIENTEYVAADFNRIEINNASSVLNWTNISITALGTVAKGELEMVDNATFNDTGGVFTDMSTFDYLSNATILGRTYRRCGIVTQGGGTFTNCVFDEPTGVTGLMVDDVDLIETATFASDGSGHAMTLDTSHAGNSYTFTGHSFTGYATSNGTTDAVIFNDSAGAVTITVASGTGTVSYKNGTSATTTIIIPDVTLTLTGLITGSDISILEAGTTTELENAQENSGTTYGYEYASSDAGDYIDIGVFLAGYTPFYIRNYQLSASSSNLPVAQKIDRYYLT